MSCFWDNFVPETQWIIHCDNAMWCMMVTVWSSDHAERHGQHAMGDHQPSRGVTTIPRTRLRLPSLSAYRQHVRGSGLPTSAARWSHRTRTVGHSPYNAVSFPASRRRCLPAPAARNLAEASAVQALSNTAGQQPQWGVVLPHLRVDWQPRTSSEDDALSRLLGGVGPTVPVLPTVQASSPTRRHRHGWHQGASQYFIICRV